jgi:hypothetical protein
MGAAFACVNDALRAQPDGLLRHGPTCCAPGRHLRPPRRIIRSHVRLRGLPWRRPARLVEVSQPTRMGRFEREPTQGSASLRRPSSQLPNVATATLAAGIAAAAVDPVLAASATGRDLPTQRGTARDRGHQAVSSSRGCVPPAKTSERPPVRIPAVVVDLERLSAGCAYRHLSS